MLGSTVAVESCLKAEEEPHGLKQKGRQGLFAEHSEVALKKMTFLW